MNGVCIENVKGGLRGIATDGRHLVLVDVPCKLASFRASRWVTYRTGENAEKYKQDVSHIIPLQFISRLRQFLKLSKTWELLIKNGFMALVSDRHMCKLSFVDGQFPNYSRVIPEMNLIGDEKFKTLQVETGPMKTALREMKKSPLYNHVKDNPWPMWFKVDSLTDLILEMRGSVWEGSKCNQTTETRKLEIYTQEDPITELLNGFHLEHICASIKGTAQFEWQAEGKAWQVKPVVLDKELSKLLFVVMLLNKDCY
jgi:hypothetical protein